jgi:hypothetical protein
LIQKILTVLGFKNIFFMKNLLKFSTILAFAAVSCSKAPVTTDVTQKTTTPVKNIRSVPTSGFAINELANGTAELYETPTGATFTLAAASGNALIRDVKNRVLQNVTGISFMGSELVVLCKGNDPKNTNKWQLWKSDATLKANSFSFLMTLNPIDEVNSFDELLLTDLDYNEVDKVYYTIYADYCLSIDASGDLTIVQQVPNSIPYTSIFTTNVPISNTIPPGNTWAGHRVNNILMIGGSGSTLDACRINVYLPGNHVFNVSKLSNLITSPAPINPFTNNLGIDAVNNVFLSNQIGIVWGASNGITSHNGPTYLTSMSANTSITNPNLGDLAFLN